MSLEETIQKETEALKKVLSPRFLKSCKDCGYHVKQNGLLYCTQTSPPTSVLSEYYAQGCIYYTIEQLTQASKKPQVTTKYDSDLTEVPHNVGTPLITIKGVGTMLEARIEFVTAIIPSDTVVYQLQIYVDGVLGAFTDNRWLTQSETATSGRNSVGEFFQITNQTQIALRQAIEFSQEIKIMAFQLTGNTVNAVGRLSVILIK